MTTKTRNIISWSLAGIIGLIFVGSAVSKLSGSAEGLKMAEGIGLTAGNFQSIGILELVCIVLFIIPRTGVVGTILLAAYMGAAICAHLTHNLPIGAPIGIAIFVVVAGMIRFPELQTRLFGKSIF